MAKFGVYTEFDPPRRFVRTERYEGWDEYEAVMTVELVERNGKTTMTQSFLFPTQELPATLFTFGPTDAMLAAASASKKNSTLSAPPTSFTETPKDSCGSFTNTSPSLWGERAPRIRLAR